LKFRTETPVQDYSLLSFAAYFFYAPLYLAGPTTTYNAWTSQVYKPQQTHSQRQILTYALRWLVVLAILEWFCHNLVFPTIANNSDNRAIWESFSAYQYLIASYFILKWIWLKFVVIWRFFRLWALCDGIESPENMGRCMSNNYCFEEFWRQWHRAFNQWLIRYLFIPLGGSKYKIWNIWVIFGFVAIWHDLSMNLLAWGWGMCLFIMPEILVKQVLAGKMFAEFRKTLTYNWLCALAGGFYTVFMSIANLVGFSFGINGLGILMEELLTPEGIRMLTVAILFLTIGTHFMLALRRHETQRGIKRNF
jgi:D-alanyl-lipoteichoic acid acyltransferase DltB (MBOAT superfamily)